MNIGGKYFCALGCALAILAFPSLSHAQSWSSLSQAFPGTSSDTALLLTDGTVMVHVTCSPNWYKLTPDNTGSYINGTWSAAIPMQAGHGPLYFASAVLADGRLVAVGGEYNGGGCPGADTNLADIYNPTTNTWSALTPPPLANVGDGQSIVLPNGTFLVGHLFSTAIAALNPSTLSWSLPGVAGKADHNSEEGWTLLPNTNKFLTVDANPNNGTHSEIYDPITGTWTFAGNTTAAISSNGGRGIVPEVGPAILRPDGTIYQAGATTHNSIYNTSSGTWGTAPDFPFGEIADGPAALLPSGNVLVATSPFFAGPSHFYEFTTGNTFSAVPSHQNAAGDPSFVYRFLLLPTGQVLVTDGSSTVAIYTPASTAPGSPLWRPTVTTFPSSIVAGATYSISGTQFNGLSQAVAYGDDAQAATNYPLVQITNIGTGHVFYNKTHDHSTMAVATGGTVVSSSFDANTALETGPSTLVVIANGIPSAPVSVSIDIQVATTLTFTASSATTSDYHDAATVAGKLVVTSSGAGIPGETITFVLGAGTGTETCTAVTGATGVASCSITPNQAAGAYTLKATFAGDSSYVGSSASSSFTIAKEEDTVGFVATSPTVIANGHPTTFAATLKEDGVTPIAGRTLTITLGTGVTAQTCVTGATDATGTGSCSILVNQPLGPNTVGVSFAGDAFYLPSSASESAILFAFLSSGSMVIGNLNAAVGTNVEFWGAQWANLNALSAGPGPDAFKGFAATAPQSCGGSWASRPGNSSAPAPAPLPSYMGVIASSSVGKSGSTIAGDDPIIVVVKTNPGYGPDPGSPGTGTVVAVFCH
jgi:hypothetical protein